MSNPSLRLQSLSITSFRGIRGTPKPFTLDLSARLTVLLAANGTGKTSLCQAAEWLLTGEVRDFAEGDLPFTGRTEDMNVAASALVGSLPGSFSYGFSKRALTLGGRTYKTDSDIRRILAPDAVEQDGGVHASNARRDWLRGTRFLAMTDIAVLLDPDPEMQGARRKIYADLFGIQHLEEAKRRLGQYGDEVGRALRGQQRAVETIVKKLAALPPNAAAGGAEVHWRLLMDAADGLGMAAPAADLPFDGAADAVRAALLIAEKQLAERQEALRHLDALDTPVEELEAEGVRARESLAGVKAHAALSADHLRMEKARRDDLQSRAEGFRERLGAVDKTWEDALLHAPFVKGIASEEDLRENHPEMEWSEERLASRLDNLQRFQDELHDYHRDSERIQALTQQKGHEPVPSESEIKQAEVAVERAEAALAAVTAAGTDAEGALADLKRAGEALTVNAAEPGADCPLCGHDWQSASALRAAVKRTLEALPPALQRLAAERGEAEKTLAAARRLLDDLKTRRAAEADIVRLRASLDRWRTRAAALDLGAEPWEVAAEAQEQRLRAAGPLARLVRELSAAERLLDLDGHSVAVAERVARVLSDPLETELLNELKDADDSYEEQSKIASSAEAEQERLTKLLEDIGERVRAAQEAQRILFHGDTTGSTQAVRQRLTEQADRLTTARSRLQTAVEIQTQSRLAQDRAELQAEEAAARQRLEELQDKLDTASRTQTSVEQHGHNYMVAQINALWPQVRSLFGRVHANRVFDAIQPGDAPMEWVAELESYPLSAKDFSAGQRQDLALALFLARACSLKGTFFLDEPLVHLDDLNRVGVLDILRMITLTRPDVHLVLTTASRPLALHIREKFGRIKDWQGDPRDMLVNVLELQGAPTSDLAVHKL